MPARPVFSPLSMFCSAMLAAISLSACAQSRQTSEPAQPAAQTILINAQSHLPTGSRLVMVNGHALHVRSLGLENPNLENPGLANSSPANSGTANAGPAIVLLSGPTDHWHADSGWFALLQPMLAKRYRVHAIDRPGQGFSSIVPGSSYESFADDLAALLPQLESEPVIVVAFASSNLSLHHYGAKYGRQHLRAALLIDPDGLHPDLVSFYAEQAKPFQQPDKLADYVNAGKYDARAESVYEDEREQVGKLVPTALASEMDWPFYDAVAQQRRDRGRILARFAEIARYDSDVTGAAALPWPSELPVWSYDTDFERLAVDAATDPAEKQKLERWHRLSSAFMQSLPGHCRIGSASTEHLATVAEADRLLRLVERMAQGLGCPEEVR